MRGHEFYWSRIGSNYHPPIFRTPDNCKSFDTEGDIFTYLASVYFCFPFYKILSGYQCAKFKVYFILQVTPSYTKEKNLRKCLTNEV